MSQSTNIMGIPFPNVTMDQTVAILDKVVDQESNELFHVITGNPEIVMSCQRMPLFARLSIKPGWSRLTVLAL